MARGWLLGEPLPFFAELRAERPVLVLPELTLVTRYHDCAMILRRHQDFGVDLYRPKQGDYFMAQDDTADHWRDKSVMKSILDFEQVPAMRAFVGSRSLGLSANYTGPATLQAAARALRGAKPASISAVVVAVADPKRRDFQAI